MDFARRAHEAKQAMIVFKLEIKNKANLFDELAEMNENNKKMRILLRLLKGRVRSCEMIMEKS
jgi:hypothetical protein